ncbi:MAG: hypothetical protein EXR71_16365 [Myxococcales bacterium]|nr:hypothetical protein [Myxococcales bacterium]
MVQAVLSGMTHREAAAKYGVPSGNVARWVREHNAAPLRLAPDTARESVTRAREPIRGRDARASAMAEALGPQLRADLRGTIGNVTRYLADATRRAVDGDDVDMHQVAAAARALDTLLSRAADVLAFDRNTTAPAEADALYDPEAVRAEMARRRRVLPP